jgi:hypothetical protein
LPSSALLFHASIALSVEKVNPEEAQHLLQTTVNAQSRPCESLIASVSALIRALLPQNGQNFNSAIFSPPFFAPPAAPERMQNTAVFK